jgi:NodT family efflux transporter outer membrane factor (OMF) lipoprotein
VLLLSACVVGPDYHRPNVPVPPNYATALPASAPASGSARASASTGQAATDALGAWWDQFHDAQLSSLITRALQGNLDLRAAGSRVRAAREQLVIAGAARLPQLNADADVSALHLSQNSGFGEFANLISGSQGAGRSGGANNGFALPGGNITTYTLGFDASWEIDLFGGVRRSIQAARASAEQTVWQLRDTEVSVAAEIANDYWQLRALQAELLIAQQEVQRQQQMLSLLQARRRFGFVTGQDVSSQQAQLAAAQATLPDLEAGRDAQIHALGVLVGEGPEALESQLSAASSLPAAPPRIPVGLPSDLLRRRPDVRAAERALAASSARIGVAVAALYPKISLTGALDLVSLDLRHLLDLSSRQYEGGAALSWPVFAGGRGRADIRVAQEQDRQALYAYQGTVLGALRDVEDALTRYSHELQKHEMLAAEASAAQAAADVAQRQFQSGVINIGPSLVAQGTALQARLQLAQSDGALDRDLVSLYKALGGGWH